MAESYVRVAADSSGKYIRNQSLYVPVDLFDGAGPTATLVQQQVTLTADPWGKVLDLDTKPLLSLLVERQETLIDILTLMAGREETTALLSMGGLPARSDSFQPTRMLGDRFGRAVTVPHGSRELIADQYTTISSSTSETTIVTAGPGVNDLLFVLVTNTSASTDTRIDFRDSTGGTIRFSLRSIGGQPSVGFQLPAAITQTTANTNWTATCATSTTDVRIFALYVKNR